MHLTLDVALVTIVIGLILIIWLYLAAKRGHFSFLEIGRIKHNENTADLLTTSPYLTQRNLSIFRLLITIFITVVFCVYTIVDHDNPRHIPLWSWYTVWNWVLLWLYFLLSTIITFNSNSNYKYCCIKHDKFINCIRIIIWIIFQTECTAVLFIDLGIWCLSFPFADPYHQVHELLKFTDLSMHTTNFIVIYIELLINDIPLINCHHALFAMILTFIYCMFQWTINICCNINFSYRFIDPGNVWNALSYIVVFGMHLICWIIAYKFKNVFVQRIIRKSKHGHTLQQSDDVTINNEEETDHDQEKQQLVQSIK